MKSAGLPPVCHVTVLNPARHPRIFYKWAWSQKELGHEVTVIGQDSSPAPYQMAGIRIVPIRPFGRASLRRWLAPIWLLGMCLRVKAKVFVIHAPDLLPTAVFLKVFFRKKIIYDVHEDYARSLTFGDHHPAWHRWLADIWRTWECWAARRFDRIVYAEACYQGMLHVKKEKVFVLENKFSDRAATEGHYPIPEVPYLLYTGTLAPEWGVMATLDFWESLVPKNPIRLVIAGFAANNTFLEQLRARISAYPFSAQIELIGGDTPVPYGQILALIRGSVAGAAFYQLTPAIEGKHPSKFYEFQALGKPLFFTPFEDWVDYDAHAPLGIPWESGQSVADAWEALSNWQDRSAKLDKAACFWTNEAVAGVMAGLK